MIHIDFTRAEQDQLYEASVRHDKPLVRERALALYLKSLGFAHQDICEVCRITRATLSKYLKLYQEGGFAKLQVINYQGRVSDLDAYTDEITDEFKKRPPRSSAEAADRIEKITGIKRSSNAVREWIKRLGMKYIKAAVIPGKTGEHLAQKALEREIFVTQALLPRLEEAEKSRRVVYFVDAAHFVYANFLDYLWCFVRFFIPSATGRKRFNVLGALNALSKELVCVTNTDYINTYSVLTLIKKLRRIHEHAPITLVLDNASYQKNSLVKVEAKKMKIELLYLPSYSPQLNLIERFWKFTKRYCLSNNFYEDFETFKASIQNFIENANVDFKDKMETLLSWKFQTYRDVQILAG